MTRAGAFKVGDIVKVESYGTEKRTKGSIIAFRYAIANTRTGSQSIYVDMLFDDGKVGGYFLGDVARWNPERVAETFN